MQDLANAVLSKEGLDLVDAAGDVIGEDREVGAYVMYPTSLKGKFLGCNTQLVVEDGFFDHGKADKCRS